MTSSEPGTLSVRQVTDVHANWSDQGPDQDGRFSYQLILDDGAEEALIRPSAEDADVLIQLLPLANSVFFDTSNRVLIFGALEVKES